MGNPRQVRVARPSSTAPRKGMRRIKGTGYQIIVPVMLKKRWAKATWRESTLSETKEAMSAVIVVPRLAPKVKGNIDSRGITPIPTNGVKTEVVIEEDCTNMVRRAPMIIETYPLRLVVFNHVQVNGASNGLANEEGSVKG